MADIGEIRILIGKLKEHYDKHLNNKYVKNLSVKVDIPIAINQEKNLILENDLIYVDSRGGLEDLYNGIKAINIFIKEVQKNIIPNIHSYSSSVTASNENDKILQQMALKNYPMNIQMLGELLKSLFMKVYEFDKVTFAKDPAYKRVRNFYELENIYLKG